MSRSGGVSDSMNQRMVSAPYSAMMVSGATTFFLDFDILIEGPTVTLGVPCPGRPCRRALLDLVRETAIAVRILVGLVADHALREQAGKRFGDRDHAQLGHGAGEKARIEQMQDRVLDAADILIHRQPVIRGVLSTGSSAAGLVKRAKYQDESAKVSSVSVSRTAAPLQAGQVAVFHAVSASSGLPLTLKLISSGSRTGS